MPNRFEQMRNVFRKKMNKAGTASDYTLRLRNDFTSETPDFASGSSHFLATENSSTIAWRDFSGLHTPVHDEHNHDSQTVEYREAHVPNGNVRWQPKK